MELQVLDARENRRVYGVPDRFTVEVFIKPDFDQVEVIVTDLRTGHSQVHVFTGDERHEFVHTWPDARRKALQWYRWIVIQDRKATGHYQSLRAAEDHALRIIKNKQDELKRIREELKKPTDLATTPDFSEEDWIVEAPEGDIEQRTANTLVQLVDRRGGGHLIDIEADYVNGTDEVSEVEAVTTAHGTCHRIQRVPPDEFRRLISMIVGGREDERGSHDLNVQVERPNGDKLMIRATAYQTRRLHSVMLSPVETFASDARILRATV